MPIGAVIGYAGATLNDTRRASLHQLGWLVCDGAAVSRATYHLLHRVIGDMHGRGDGIGTFCVPDYRENALRNVDGKAGHYPDTAIRLAENPGSAGGDNVGFVQGDELRAHDHVAVQMIYHDNSGDMDRATKHSDEPRDESRQTGITDGKETRPANACDQWLIRWSY